MDRPIRVGSPVQRFARANAESLRKVKPDTAHLMAHYRDKDGWEDGTYIERTPSGLDIVRVGVCEYVCHPKDVRIGMVMTNEIVKAADQPDDEWLVTLATDFRRWGNQSTAERLEKIANGMAGKGRKPKGAGIVRRSATCKENPESGKALRAALFAGDKVPITETQALPGREQF